MLSRSLRISPIDCLMEELRKKKEKKNQPNEKMGKRRECTSSLPSKVGTECQDVVALNLRVDDVARLEGILGGKAVWDIGVPHAWVQSEYPVCQ